MPGNLGHRGFLLRVSGRRELIVCSLDGDGKAGLNTGWCGWVSGTLCAQGSRPSSCICRHPGIEGGLLLLFPW